MEFREYSLESLRDESIKLARLVEKDGYRPDCVAYLARGGWAIGKAISEHFGAPLIELSAHRSGNAAKERSASLLARLPRSIRRALREWEMKKRLSGDNGETQRKSVRLTERYDAPADARRILLVDDSADTGSSLAAACEKLSDMFPGADVRTAVLNIFPRAKSAARIDWYMYESSLLCLPSSKDNAEYPLFVRKYEEVPPRNDVIIMQGHPLISVVVAFYNVEGCVDYCVKSLLAQTYENYEVVLVDDGSTDGTGDKLDGYANGERIRLIHKSNGGLSDARNVGVSVAKGEYITFVDGDDLVSPRYLEVLARGLNLGENVLVAALPTIIPIKEAVSYCWEESGSARFEKISSEEALEKVLYEEIKTSAWGKLAPRSVYEETPFPEGRYYEEISTIGSFVLSVSEVVVTDAEIYGYVMRPGSIVHRKSSTIKQAEDYLSAVNTITSCSKDALIDEKTVKYHQALQYSRLLRLLRTVNDSDNKIVEIEKQCIGFIRKNLWKVITNRRVSSTNKMRFAFQAFCPSVYDRAFSAYEKISKGIR